MRLKPRKTGKVEKLAHRKSVREMTPAERWATYFLYNAGESVFARELIEEITKEEEAVKMAAEVMHEYTADEKRYYHLLSEMKYELDHYNHMAEAEDRGEKRGRAAERERAAAQIIAEREKREKAEAQIAAMEAEKAAERAAMMNALRAAGVSEDIIREAYKDAERGDA